MKITLVAAFSVLTLVAIADGGPRPKPPITQANAEGLAQSGEARYKFNARATIIGDRKQGSARFEWAPLATGNNENGENRNRPERWRVNMPRAETITMQGTAMVMTGPAKVEYRAANATGKAQIISGTLQVWLVDATPKGTSPSGDVISFTFTPAGDTAPRSFEAMISRGDINIRTRGGTNPSGPPG